MGAAQQKSVQLLNRWLHEPRVRATILIVALAAIVRAFVIIRAVGMLDGDEAVLGVQAENILHGAHPIYFYGQAYMGSWDAYLAAPLVALFGPSAAVLHTITAAESLALIPLMGILAARLYGERTRVPAMLLAAVPPLFVAAGELRMLGGYVETLILGAALLLVAVTIADRLRIGYPTRWQWILGGLLTGAALWIDMLIVYYLVACAIWLAPLVIAHVRSADLQKRGGRLRSGCVHLVTFALAACATASPAIIYGSRHSFENVTYFSGLNQSLASANPLRLGVLRYYFQAAAPHVLGAQDLSSWTHSGGVLIATCHVVALCAALGALGYSLVRVGRWLYEVARRQRIGPAESAARQWNNVLPLLLLVAVTLIFWRSPSTGNTPLFAYVDAASRYALPLTTVVTLGLASAVVDLPTAWVRLTAWIRRHMGRLPLTVSQLRQTAVFSVLIAMVVAGYALPYLLTDEVTVMQSPFAAGTRFPVDDQSLLLYLTRQHIRYLWTDHWYGNDIMFLDNQQVLCADYVDIVVWNGANRFPAVFSAVQTADRPSFLISSDSRSGEPAVARALDALHVTYTSAAFGNLWVITPTSRTVAPAEILPALEQDHGV